MSTGVAGTNRALAAAGVLVLVWIVVWWMTPVRPEPGVSFASDARSPALTRTDATPVEPRVVDGPRTDWSEPPAAPAREAASTTPVTTPATRPDGAPPTAPYTVRSGDTMKSIARDTLGDASKWTILARANPRVDPIRLRAGMVLQIPQDPDNIQGGPGVASTKTASNAASAATTVYVVEKGDTLSGIASRLLGSSGRWPEIMKANAGLLKAPEDLRPGMRLSIPAR